MSKRNPIFDALRESEGHDPNDPVTRTEGSRIGKAAAELSEIGATVEDIRQRRAMYEKIMPGAYYTANALVKHWSRLKPSVQQNTETEWEWACRRAKEIGLDNFKGAPPETQGQFIQRVKNSEKPNLKIV